MIVKLASQTGTGKPFNPIISASVYASTKDTSGRPIVTFEVEDKTQYLNNDHLIKSFEKKLERYTPGKDEHIQGWEKKKLDHINKCLNNARKSLGEVQTGSQKYVLKYPSGRTKVCNDKGQLKKACMAACRKITAVKDILGDFDAA